MKICSIEGCEGIVKAKGYCNKHWLRKWRHGDPLIVKSPYRHRIHGKTNSPEFYVWCRMRQRCFDKNHPRFHRYGGRGITVCDKWRNSFIAFFEDMGPKPFPKAQIDRKNNDGNYEPDNCRWVTNAQNNRNRSDIKLTIEKVKEIRTKHKTGKTSYKKLALIYGVHFSTIGYIVKQKLWKGI